MTGNLQIFSHIRLCRRVAVCKMLHWLLIFIAGLLLGNYIRRKKRSSMLSTAPAQPLPNAGEILQSPGIDGHREFVFYASSLADVILDLIVQESWA